MKGNVIQMNTLHLNSVRLNGIGKVQSVSLKGGSTEDPVFPPVEPPVEPTPTYTLSASVTNGKVSATLNGSAVNLPYTANEGDVIIVEVTPNEGYTFEGWNDGNTDNPRSITMNADVVLSAQCVEVVQPPVGNYIQFEDKAVEAICVANWSSDGIGLTEEDAAAVTTIGTTFKGNTEITSFDELQYFTGVTTLEAQAFYGCSNLVSLTLPPNVTAIPNGNKIGGVMKGGVFAECPSLALLDCSNITSIGGAAFYNTPVQLTNTDKVVSIGENALEGGGSGDISLPSLETFNRNAMSKSKISRILSLGKIKNNGTAGSQNYGGYGAFYGSTLLTFINFPNTIEEISAFSCFNCTALTTIICRAITPPTLGGTNAFNNTNNCPIYVPDASLEAYRTATNWSAYADRIHPLSEIEGDDSRLDYVHDSMLMWLDGIDKGTVEGEWQDLVGNNNFINVGAVELANGYQFNGDSNMRLVPEGSPMQWSDDTTLEVVVDFAGNNTYDVILISACDNGVAFGRTPSQLIVASNNERPAYADPLAGYAAGKAVVAVNKNTTLYNGSPLATQGTNYFGGNYDITSLGNWHANFFKGIIHAIRIHNRILSEEEILYNQRIDNKRFNLGLDI